MLREETLGEQLRHKQNYVAGVGEDLIAVCGAFKVACDATRIVHSLQQRICLVRPRISLEGVSGLESLVSGVYIECVPGPKGKLVQNFVGRSSAAAAWQDDQSGLEVVITASTTSIGVDAPVYYRGLRVGKVERKTLSSDGRNVGLIVLIDRPYSYLIRENTKFWDTSGLKASLGFLFIKVPTETLESLVRGGLAFATPDNRDMGAPVKPGHEFKLNKVPRREWLRWTPSLSLTKE